MVRKIHKKIILVDTALENEARKVKFCSILTLRLTNAY